MRRTALIAGGLVLLALLLLVSGHWILGVIFGIAAVVAGGRPRRPRSGGSALGIPPGP